MTKLANAYTFHPGPNGESLSLYGIDARDLDTADLARLDDEQKALLLRETDMYRPVEAKKPAADPPKES